MKSFQNATHKLTIGNLAKQEKKFFCFNSTNDFLTFITFVVPRIQMTNITNVVTTFKQFTVRTYLKQAIERKHKMQNRKQHCYNLQACEAGSGYNDAHI